MIDCRVRLLDTPREGVGGTGAVSTSVSCADAGRAGERVAPSSYGTRAAHPTERLVAYDVGWPSSYRTSPPACSTHWGQALEVEHDGSTSVPGLEAKPVIGLALRLPVGRTLDWSRPEN